MDGNANNGANVNNNVASGGNASAAKLKRMLKSKGFVTGVCAVAAVAVLLVGYNIRINSVTKPVELPVAKYTIDPKTKITDDMIEYKKIPKGALSSDYYSSKTQIINKYSNINAMIPKGSMFFTELLVNREELPDTALYDLKEGETLYYLTVNMLTSYTNSIMPNNYIDIYISTKENDKALVGKLLQDVKILAVKTADGKNVFEGGDESRTPYVILFALKEENHLLLRKINAINNYSISDESGKYARIEIIPIPTNVSITNRDEEIETTISSQYLKDYILNMAAELPEEIPDIDFNAITTDNSNENSTIKINQ